MRTPSLPLTELRHEFRQVENSGHVFQEEQNGFRQLLAQGLPGCPAAQASLPRLPYSEHSFERVIDLYNNCIAPPARRQPPPPGLQVGVGIVGGVQSGQVAFADPYAPEPQQHSVTVSGPVYGAEIGVRTRRLSSVLIEKLFRKSRKTL